MIDVKLMQHSSSHLKLSAFVSLGPFALCQTHFCPCPECFHHSGVQLLITYIISLGHFIKFLRC